MLEAARTLLRQNDRGGYTIPAEGLYPFQWLWDSGFTALGWATFAPERAWLELKTLFLGQWENGFLPHIVFHREAPSYFPGPEVWGVDRRPQTSGLTQPPFLAPVVLHLLAADPDRPRALEEARGLYPKLLAFHRFLHHHRDPQGTGLVAVLHPWETGMDNSPAWDLALAQVPQGPLPPFRRRDLEHVPPSERPRAEDYRRYLYLLLHYRKLGYDPEASYREAPFLVADVGFNALLLYGDEALMRLAQALGEDPQEPGAWLERGLKALESLWDEGAGLYRSWDLRRGEAIAQDTASGLLPLLLPLPQARVVRLHQKMAHFTQGARHLLPTVPPRDPAFEARRYWRGPVWAPVNYLLAQGFRRHGLEREAHLLESHLLELVEGQGFREYYDPLTGEGLGGRGFSWTAALYLALKA
ncbi:trehalase family glycosidase [Thermus sp. FJN-A]